MNKKLKLLISAMMLTAVMLLSAPIARADLLSVTYTSVSGKPGDTGVPLTVTVTNIGSDLVNLDGDALSLAGSFGVNDEFLANSPFTLDPGQSSTFELLTLDFPSDAGLGSYTGSFIIYGDTGGASSALNGATESFTVNVVPEPSSMLLLGSGLTGLVGVIRRRRQQ